MTRDRVADAGDFVVEVSRSIRSGKKVHSIQVRASNGFACGGSGRSLAEAFRSTADKLDEQWNGGPLAPVVWGSDADDKEEE